MASVRDLQGGKTLGLSALPLGGWVSVIFAVDQIEILVPGFHIAVRAREYVELKVRPGHKSVRVAEGFLDSRVGNLTVYKLFLAPGANKDPSGHEYLPVHRKV
jgi:hypothetical protein